MNNKKIINTLGKLHRLLAPVKAPWFIIGTASLLLAGYDVEPNDIDILTDSETAAHINILLKGFEQSLQLKDEGKFRSVFSRYVINGISIELMGDLKVNTYNGWVTVLPLITNKQQIALKGGAFNIPSKSDQIKIYTLFGRPKDESVLKLLSAT